VIAGAGTVGLAVAALLATGRAADRLAVHVLDAKPLPRWRADDVHLRVYALSRASQQLLEQVGVWQRVLGMRASPYRRMHVWEGEHPFASGALEFDAADIGEPDLGHIVEDNLLRAVQRSNRST
jgi:2-octaprenylphenol hydroxylase